MTVRTQVQLRMMRIPNAVRDTDHITSIRARLLLCIHIPGSVASVNRFSSRVVRCPLLCIGITVDPVSAFVLACQPNSALVENADAC